MADQPTHNQNPSQTTQTGALSRTNNPPPLLPAPHFTLSAFNPSRDSSDPNAKHEERQQIYRKYLDLCEGEKILVNQLKMVK
jgi:hypothetical protein